ncbi:MAG TPA: hypothetical protein VIP28_15150 [Nocardioides sp.]
MADSPAERARRARRHKKGDHSLCDPARRCQLIEQTEVREAVASQEARESPRGPRGQELWDALADEGLGPAHRLLLDETCRMADRLDRLNGSLENKNTWLRFEAADGGSVVVVVDGVLAEYRQQVATLRSLVAEIRAVLPKPESKPAAPAKPEGGLGDLVSLAAAARRRSTAG